MSAHESGGPAFPLHIPAIPGEPDKYWNGMTLRDWFAGQALVGNLAYSHVNPSTGNFQENCSTNTLARICYDIADAMLEARKK